MTAPAAAPLLKRAFALSAIGFSGWESTDLQLNTLKKNREFSLVYQRGKSQATKNLVLVYLPRKYGGVRVGFSVSKKIGCSVVRNRVRRRLRESMKLISPELKGSAHLVFVARKPIAEAAFSQINGDMIYLLKKVGQL